MPRVVHFELPAEDLERASQFYHEVFGWQTSKWGEDYLLVMTGEGEAGINGGIMRREPNREATTNTIDVPSVDEYVAKIVAQGGTVVAPKMPIPNMGYLAYCKDPEGNIFGIMQADATAA